jgi:RNA polymerase sigma factor (sigma-70 family)
MATVPLGTLLRHIHRQAAGPAVPQPSDHQLLEAFTTRRDEAAFAALIARHGRMVLRVCRRVLGHEQDAEDAFQATFLVLAQSGSTIRKREALSQWLHGVAYRTAMVAKRSAARRHKHEARLWDRASQTRPSPTWDDVQAVLDEEIRRLPEAFRTAFVLCVLEGKSGPQAALELGVREGTVSSRLVRARQRLQRQLARRGIKLSALLVAVSVAQSGEAAVPAGLAGTALRCGLWVVAGRPAAGSIPSHVAALAAGVTRAVFVARFRIATAVVLAVGVLAGAALGACRVFPASNAQQALAGSPQPDGFKDSPPRTAVTREADETFVYRGRVLGADGKPLAGAKLYVILPGRVTTTTPVRATTGSDGRFEFTVNRAGFVPAGAPADLDVFAFLQVVATAKGHGPDWTVIGNRPAGELTLRLGPIDAAIRGRILDLQGKPVGGATVRVLRLETTPQDDLAPFLASWKSQPEGYLAGGLLTKVLQAPWVAGLPRAVTTSDDGRFRIPGAGCEQVVLLSVEARRIEHATFRVLPRSAAEVKALVRPASEEMLRRGAVPPPVIYGRDFDHLAMPARMIVGTVRDKETGKPMSGVRISGNAVGVSGDTRVETYTDKQGRYQLVGLPKAARYQLLAWPGDFSAYIPGGKEVAGGEGVTTARADFEMMRGIEVRGHITDKVTGKPVAAGVRYVPLGNNRHPGAAFFRMVSKNCEGMRVGTLREMVPPGPGVFLVIVRAADDDNPYTQVRLDPAERVKTGLDDFLVHGVNAYRVIDVPADARSMAYDIQVDPGRRVTGSVLGPDGKPLAGALVKGLTAVWPQPRALKSATFTAVALDPHERRQLLFVHLQRKLAGHLVLRGDEKDGVRVRLETWGALTGRILDEDGRPLAGVRIQLSFLHSTFSLLPVTWWVPPLGEQVQTDRDGRFRAAGMTPGMSIHLSVATDRKFLPLAGTPDGMRTLSVRPGETKDLGDLQARPD